MKEQFPPSFLDIVAQKLDYPSFKEMQRHHFNPPTPSHIAGWTWI